MRFITSCHLTPEELLFPKRCLRDIPCAISLFDFFHTCIFWPYILHLLLHLMSYVVEYQNICNNWHKRVPSYVHVFYSFIIVFFVLRHSLHSDTDNLYVQALENCHTSSVLMKGGSRVNEILLASITTCKVLIN